MTTSPREPDAGDRNIPQEDRLTRLSVNLSAETADSFRSLIKRKGLSITEGIRRAIAVWKFVEDETSRGNQLAVIEQDGSVRKVILLLIPVRAQAQPPRGRARGSNPARIPSRAPAATSRPTWLPAPKSAQMSRPAGMNWDNNSQQCS